MCGIVGGNIPRWDYSAALDIIRHRGPDDKKLTRLFDFTLGFVRLSIIDLSTNGMQPMLSADGNVALVFNGEIYGYKRLSEELISCGYSFISSSDTEVLLAAYLKWGEQFVEKIDGMFAIGIWDNRDHKLRLYRDRVGIKPLYYYTNGLKFAFGSELKAITTLIDDEKFEIDNSSVFDYLNYRYIPEPKTLYRNVRILLPGHMLIYDLDSCSIEKIEKYWNLYVNSTRGREKKREVIIDDIKSLVSESVRDQIVSDVPVGTFLSGGVDSSIVSYECNKLNPRIETFSIGFEDKYVDETKYVYEFLSKYPMPSNKAIFKKVDIDELFMGIRDWYDEPFADDSAYPTYLVSKLAKKKVTVVLTGDGSDEIFGGYARYGRMWRNDKGRRPDYSLIQKEYGEDIDSRERTWREYLGIPMDYDRYWPIKTYYNVDLPPITRCQLLDFNTYLSGDILTKVDRASMQVSLEVRVPFLSRKLVEYAFSLSEEDRCPGGMLKGALKSAYEEELGQEYLNRTKQGFGVPSKYFIPQITKQEEILKRVWNIGNDITRPERTELEKTRELSEKHLSMVKLYDSWVAVNQANKEIGSYLLKKGVQKVAIYGYGIIGERLALELKDSLVEVLYAIDQRAKELLGAIPIREVKDIDDDVDAIIVTSSFYFVEIESELKKHYSKDIINFEELLYEILEGEAK